MPQIPQISGPISGGKTLSSGTNSNTQQNTEPFSIDGVNPVQRTGGVTQKGDAAGAGSRGVADQSALPPGLQAAKDPSMAVETLHEVFSGELLENAKLNGYTELVGEIDDLTKAIYINPDKLMDEIMTQEKDNTVFAGNQLFEILRELCAESGEDTKDLIANLLKTLNYAMSRKEILSAVKSNIKFLAEYFGQNTSLSKSLYQLYDKWNSGDPAKNFEQLKNETAALMRSISGSLQNDSRTETLVPLVTHNLSRYNTNEYMMKEAFTQLMSQVPKASMREGLSKAFTEFVTKLLKENTNSYNNNTTNSAENQVLGENFDVSAEKAAILVYLSRLSEGLESGFAGNYGAEEISRNGINDEVLTNAFLAEMEEEFEENTEIPTAFRGIDDPMAGEDGERTAAFRNDESRIAEQNTGRTADGGTERAGADAGSERAAANGGTERAGTYGNTERAADGGTERAAVDGGTERAAADGSTERAAFDVNTERAATDGNTERAATDGNTERVAADGNTERAATDGGTERAAADGGTERAAADGGTERATTERGIDWAADRGTERTPTERGIDWTADRGTDRAPAERGTERTAFNRGTERAIPERGFNRSAVGRNVDRTAANRGNERTSIRDIAAYRSMVQLNESRIAFALSNFNDGLTSGRDAIGRLLALLIPRGDTDAAEIMQTVVKNTGSITEMVNFLNKVLENIPDIPERQTLCDAFETIVYKMAQEHEMPAEKSSGEYESETVKALTSFIERNVNHPAIRGIDNFNASNLLQSILNAPGVFTPLAHYIIPLQVEDTRAFGELWVDNDNTSKSSPDGEKSYHLFLTFDVEAVGRFEVDAYSTGKELNLSVLYPKSYRYRVPALTDKITRIAAGVGFNVQNFKTGILIKPHTLAETFPRITENRRSFDVKA